MGSAKFDYNIYQDEIMTTSEVATFLKTTKAAIDNLCHRRKLSYSKLTKQRLFSKATVMREFFAQSISASC